MNKLYSSCDGDNFIYFFVIFNSPTDIHHCVKAMYNYPVVNREHTKQPAEICENFTLNSSSTRVHFLK